MEVGTQKLLASPASILAYYIINSLAKMTDPSDKDDWPLYKSHLPDGVNVKTDAGVIYDTTGVNEMRSMNGDVPIHPGIQIMIRSRDYDTGFIKIEDIARTLDKVFNASVTISGTVYEIQNVSRTTPVVSLGLEVGTTKRRFLFTVNFILTIRLVV